MSLLAKSSRPSPSKSAICDGLPGNGVGAVTITANILANVTGITQNSTTSPMTINPAGANTFTGPVNIKSNLFQNNYAGVGFRGVPNDPRRPPVRVPGVRDLLTQVRPATPGRIAPYKRGETPIRHHDLKARRDVVAR